MKIFITGAAGYIGGMLTHVFLNDPQVERIIALDLKEKDNLLPKEIQNHPKLVWVTYNLGDDGWQDKVLKEGPIDAVIHCAYIIRQGYGKKRAWQVKSNITAAEKLFDFVFKNKILSWKNDWVLADCKIFSKFSSNQKTSFSIK